MPAIGGGWIGADDRTIEGDWKWANGPEEGQTVATGSNATYSNWHSGEPNNYWNQDAAYITNQGTWGSWDSGKWDDTWEGLELDGYYLESEEVSVTAPSFSDDWNIEVASDSDLTAQAFSNLDAAATSTSGDATANAGDATSSVTGIEANMDISIGGLSDLLAQAQGTADADASTVSGEATALAAQQSLGIEDLEMLISSDSDLNAISSIFGGANAENITAGIAEADIDFDATGIDGISMSIGGIGTLASTASVNGSSDASSVSDMARASADMDATGINDAHLFSSSDGDISGTAVIDATVNSINIGTESEGENESEGESDKAFAFGDFDAEGITELELGVGGVASLIGQAQVTVDMNASSVQGEAEANSAYNDKILESLNQITGLGNVELDGASVGSITGMAIGDFTTTADSVSEDASASAAQSMRGIENLNLDLGGSGTINAIVNDTSYVSASSVSGNASATASVDAIGLDGGDIHIAGDATIVASVNAQSDAVASTVG